MKKQHRLVSQSEAARQLHRNRATVANWISKGAPSHNGRVDVEELRQWQAQRPPGPIMTHLRKVQRETAVDPAAEAARIELDAVLAGLDAGEGIDAAVGRLRQTERIAFRLLREVQGRGDSAGEQIRSRLHVDAVAGLVRVEALIDVREQVRREERGEIEQGLVEWSDRVKMLLQAAPRYLSARLCPVDPANAEIELRRWILEEFYPCMNNTAHLQEKKTYAKENQVQPAPVTPGGN